MSFDLAVWKDDHNGTLPSDSEAQATYLELCNNECGGGPVACEIEEFYTELTRRYPEIDDVPEEEVDNCPWSVLLNRSGHHVIMSAVWSRADEIRSVAIELAKKHDLTLFDPQEGKVVWPPRPTKKRWFNFA
ncbi:MAG: hypothetical protein WCC99_13640 [Candidatus Sulfotelmatobacter sp.]